MIRIVYLRNREEWLLECEGYSTVVASGNREWNGRAFVYLLNNRIDTDTAGVYNVEDTVESACAWAELRLSIERPYLSMEEIERVVDEMMRSWCHPARVLAEGSVLSG